MVAAAVAASTVSKVWPSIAKTGSFTARKRNAPLARNDDAQGLAFDFDDYGPLVLGTA